MECKLKAKCPNKTDALYNCCDSNCDGWMHEKCSTLLLNRYEVPMEDRPSEEERTASNEPIVFCKKGCFGKWIAAKKKEKKAAITAEKAAKQASRRKKIPWEEDGCLETLMEWMTTEGNYAEYCGANGNKGKTKTQHHKELAILLKEKHPSSERTEKDVENKIVSLERQFRVASDWANNTGQGVDNPGDFEAAILKYCPLFKELEPIMGDRPNAKPLATSEDMDDELGIELDTTSGVADQAALLSMNNSCEDDETPKKSSTSSVSSGTASSNKRLSASSESAPKKKKPKNVDDIVKGYLGMDESDIHGLRVREVEAKEREARAKMIEAEAIREKTKNENGLIDIQRKATLLRERKKLLEEGISQEEIDEYLPLKHN